MRERFIRNHIRSMAPYAPVIPLAVLSDQLGIPVSDLVKLDANENPYGVPPTAKARLAALQYGHSYPDPESRALRERLSQTFDLPTQNILAGAGADELIDLILRLTLDPGEKVINCPPTFSYYDTVAEMNDLVQVQVPRRPDFSLDLPGIQAAVDSGAKLVFLANPNNPDGSLIPTEELEQILAQPLLVVVDEAYVDFAPPGTSLIRQAIERENLIVLRTFSKWGGLAGIRLGFGAFPSAVIEQLQKIKPPYNVSTAASEAGIGALEDIAVLNAWRDRIIMERKALFEVLTHIPWLEPYPSQANFILCRVLGKDAEALKSELAQHGILIRYFHKPGLEDHIRISIGKPEDSDRLLAVLKEVEP